jgi:drug/metabolite transporter (DMT)-like permease
VGVKRTLALFVTAAVLFGGTFVATKAGLAYLPPLLFVALRFDIGAAVLVSYAVVSMSRDELRPRTAGDIVGIVATGALVIGFTNVFLFVGQQYTTSGVAAIVFSLNPILTPVFAAVLLTDERLSVRAGVGMALGLAGVVLVANPASGGTVSATGIAILSAGAVTSALGAVIIRRADTTLSSTARTVWGVPLAAVLSHLLSLGAGQSLSGLSVTPTAVVALLYVGVFSGAIAYLAYFALIDTPHSGRVGSRRVAVARGGTLGADACRVRRRPEWVSPHREQDHRRDGPRAGPRQTARPRRTDSTGAVRPLAGPR